MKPEICASVWVLIPAFNPDGALVELVRELTERHGFKSVLVVDDGSGPGSAQIFEQIGIKGCIVLRGGVNRGKGRALKAGIKHLLREGGNFTAVLTADADGQHRSDDCRAVVERWARSSESLVLGCRALEGPVPWRSRAGNGAMRAIFRRMFGVALRDTQTGLRALPRSILADLLRVEGERYEFETSALLWAASAGLPIIEQPISTIYKAGNSTSHFCPLADSFRICAAVCRHLFRRGQQKGEEEFSQCLEVTPEQTEH